MVNKIKCFFEIKRGKGHFLLLHFEIRQERTLAIAVEEDLFLANSN